MSAYLHQKNTGGFTISQGPISQFHQGSELGVDLLSSSQSVPHIMSELENFVSQFKNAEAALIQERTKALQIWQELRDFRSRFDRVKLEYEEKIADKVLVQEKLQGDLNQALETEKKLNQELCELEQKLKALEEDKKRIQEESKKSQWSAVNQERERTHKYYHELKKLYSHYLAIREKWQQSQKSWSQQMILAQEKHALEKKKILEVFAEDKSKILAEKQRLAEDLSRLHTQMSTEKDQIQALKTQIAELGQGQKRGALERDELRRKGELLKARLLQYYQAYQRVHSEAQRMKSELERAELKLSQSQGEGASAESSGFTSLEEERKHHQCLEDLLEQERREKELVQRELQAAESRIAEVSQELETFKQQWMQDQGIASEGLELKF